jgi:hypothetical protein
MSLDWRMGVDRRMGLDRGLCLDRGLRLDRQWRRGSWSFLDDRPFRLATGFRLIENAGNRRQRIVGRVALTHDSASGSNSVCGIGVPVAARIVVLASE